MCETDVIEPASAAMDHLGVYQTAWSDGFARFEADIAPIHLNRSGIPHGGIYAAMLDTAMGYCGAYTGSAEDQKMTMTLSMTVNYLSRPKGTRLIAEGRQTGGGARTFFAEGWIMDESGELIATAVGTFRIRG